MGVRDELEELGVDVEAVLKIAYGPEARWIIQQMGGCSRDVAEQILHLLKENA